MAFQKHHKQLVWQPVVEEAHQSYQRYRTKHKLLLTRKTKRMRGALKPQKNTELTPGNPLSSVKSRSLESLLTVGSM